MDLGLAGKAVVVTGGARGIGLACAQAFAREGARVAILDREADLLADAAASIEALGAEVMTVVTDVSGKADVVAAHEQVIARFGGIDVGFNNAGIGSKFCPIEDVAEEDWDRVVAVNLKGVFLCIQAQVKHMKPRGAGSIVCTASNVSFAGSPGGSGYVATKHGIVGIVRSAALELAKTGVRINCVAPGWIETDIAKSVRSGSFVDPFPDALLRQGLPIGRLGQPNEIADAVVWLASPRASLVHGEVLVADGGFLAQ